MFATEEKMVKELQTLSLDLSSGNDTDEANTYQSIDKLIDIENFLCSLVIFNILISVNR